MITLKLIIKNKKYFIDGFDPQTNTCYEFYGDYWHGNPKIFKFSDINKNNKKTFGELYHKTLKRERLIKSMGYNLIIIWENDYHSSL